MTNSTDVATRLRVPHYLGDDAKARLPEPAADLIYLLRQERKEAADLIEKLIAALEPFADYANYYEGIYDYATVSNDKQLNVAMRHLRSARTALHEVQK